MVRKLITQCKYKHTYTTENTYIRKDNGCRECLTCRNNKSNIRNETRRKQQLTKRLARQRDYVLPNLQILAWVTGFLEGEGSISIINNFRKGTTNSVVVIGNTDLELLSPLRSVWKGYFRPRKKKSGCKLSYEWRISGQRAAWFLEDIKPFIQSNRNKKRIELILETEKLRLEAQKSKETKHRIHLAQQQLKKLNQRGDKT